MSQPGGTVESVLSSLAEILFPGACPGCGAPGGPVCAECASRLSPAPRLAVPAGLDGLGVAFAYRGVARELVARVKYRNARGALPWLADAMVAVLPAHAGFELVTWAPTTPTRRRARGFDHGELLARMVARRLRRPALCVLVRPEGPPQTGADRAARRVGPTFAGRPIPAGCRILVVDDVVTTGATLAAAATTVRGCGAIAVWGLAAAGTP